MINLLNALNETRKKLENEIALVGDAQFNSKPDKNTWSIAQVCHHLVLVEEASLKAIAYGLKELDSITKEHKNIQLIMLDRTTKIKAPRVVEPDAKPFQVQQMLDLLQNSRGKSLTFLNTIDDKSILETKSVKHPALDELRLDQWIEQIYLHEQRHIEQIQELKVLLEA
ncbi:DinB family protein [Bacillus massiliigorillae]|uniref:DinB family protein n=1 Tax=Bacillus massiliigorillae TaxID=1243664 RepID=UPI00039C26F7|nr:DinB family protein [Bacillus massiliigorillae]